MRPDDSPEPRRESLMERRLRKSRGEDVDDEPVEPERGMFLRPLDDEPAPYAPFSGPGGGCAQVTLILVLGALIALLILVVTGSQVLNSLRGLLQAPSLPQVLPQPTTAVIDRGGTLQQIRAFSRLQTVLFSLQAVKESRYEGTFLGLQDTTILLVAAGDVTAGVDLGKLDAEQITISEEGGTITVRLPPSEIFGVAIDTDNIRYYVVREGLFVPDDVKDQLRQQALQQADDSILQLACENGVMQRAADEAKISVERLLRALDFENITVEAPAGECAAPAP